MKQREVILLPLAKRDLNEIWRYINEKSSEPIADTVIARLLGTLDVLAAAPLIGRVRNEYPGSLRSFPVRSHMIFYLPLPDKAGIVVWRVVHGARNLRRIIRRPGDDN